MLLLTTYIVIFCYVSIFGVTAKNVLITGNDKIKDLYVRNNSEFYVFLERYPITRYYWILENVEEIKNSCVEPLGLRESYASDEPSAGSFRGNTNDGGFDIFTFRINNSTMEELPQLKFLYTYDFNNENTGIHAQVNLLADESEETYDNIQKFTIYDTDRDFHEVEGNSLIEVILSGSLSQDYSLSSGNSWFFENAGTFKSNGLIELIDTNYGVNSYIFIFKLKEVTKKDVLPVLHFSYKESSKSSSVKKTTSINLRQKGETHIIFKEPDLDLKERFNPKNNEILDIEIKGNPSTGYKWYLENAEEVKKFDDIELLNLNGDTEGTFISDGSLAPGTGGTYHFKFQIKETAKPGKLQPVLKFIQARTKAGNELKSTIELTLKIREERKQEDLLDDSLPVITYEDNKEQIVYIESNSILKISQPDSSYSSTGMKWRIANIDEINRSDVIDFIDEKFKSDCEDFEYMTTEGGCSGVRTFRFRIWDVIDEDELPIIKMYNSRGEYDENSKNNLNITMKLKSGMTDCSFNGYKCCFDTNAEVFYQDKDGDWSIENNDWCIIKKEDSSPKLIRTCNTEAMGYPCCKKQEVVYTESDGQKWGIEDNNWCGIYTCIYTGEYPVCSTTTEIVYTDSVKWGIENQSWCVLCL